MKNRKKVILHQRDDYGGNDCKLALIDDQIKLLNWLLYNEIIDSNEWDIQVLDDAEEWVEV